MTDGGCVTGKIVYGSRRAACSRRGSGRNEGQRMRAYLCPLCHGWHLTTEKFRRAA